LTTIIVEDFSYVPSINVDCNDHASVCGNEVRLVSWEEKVIGIWDHLVWVIGPSTVT
jgi:hypothetical protein